MKAQINMFETIAVLVVFMFLLGVGLVVYAGIHKSSLEKDVSQARDVRSVRIAETAFFMPELDCTFRGVRPPGACLEKLKIDALTTINSDPLKNANYFELFGTSKITITQHFPPTDDTGAVYVRVIYDAGAEGIVKIHRTPVLLLDVTKGPTAYSFGVMEVETSFET
ncbi:MAG: hypothetical protein QF486_06285 [Candidatus Woesearchaeota archaeon]|jgi:hypothetical protein|nr:hypothetical protein [Candidatus Woesearchaeota archaeon]MDP7199194.1 hypothetical protein [Candidatus Woesearchaeota archaeon]MDP7467543.1 hypothetical protein [Candidatus Woesearchaeota archaeon]MDP7647025.1 hypothetical protein [Candidatus Woesearchaeota archaeon]